MWNPGGLPAHHDHGIHVSCFRLLQSIPFNPFSATIVLAGVVLDSSGNWEDFEKRSATIKS